MKSCPSCKTVVNDDYYGQCTFCGANPFGSDQGTGGPNLNQHLNRMRMGAIQDNALEQSLKGNDLSAVSGGLVDRIKRHFGEDLADE